MVLTHRTVCVQGQQCPSVSEQPAADGERQAEEIEWEENGPFWCLENDSIFHCCESFCGICISASFFLFMAVILKKKDLVKFCKYLEELSFWI